LFGGASVGKIVLIMELINNVAKAHGLSSLVVSFTSLYFPACFRNSLVPIYQVGFLCLLVLVKGLVKAKICTGK
jgi:hypothetical protein